MPALVIGTFGEPAGEAFPAGAQSFTHLGERVVDAHVHERVDIP